mmetsp:Transcript_30065/g.105726  ORF Transcript_30065/g.105726 Transcript_30065/m.105726 type:complete len:214 (+) Transcript_30065:68-709(+)
MFIIRSAARPRWSVAPAPTVAAPPPPPIATLNAMTALATPTVDAQSSARPPPEYAATFRSTRVPPNTATLDVALAAMAPPWLPAALSEKIESSIDARQPGLTNRAPPSPEEWHLVNEVRVSATTPPWKLTETAPPAVPAEQPSNREFASAAVVAVPRLRPPPRPSGVAQLRKSTFVNVAPLVPTILRRTPPPEDVSATHPTKAQSDTATTAAS